MAKVAPPLHAISVMTARRQSSQGCSGWSWYNIQPCSIPLMIGGHKP